jgi:oligoendopeptidase F
VTLTETDRLASDVAWDIEPLVDGSGDQGVTALIDRAEALVAEIEAVRGTVATMTAEDLAAVMRTSAEIGELLGRAGSYAGLRFAVDTSDGALLQSVWSGPRSTMSRWPRC